MMERFEDLNAVKKKKKKEKVNQSETGEENSVCPLRACSDLSKQMEIEAVILASRAAKVSLVTVCLPLGQVRVRSSDCVSRGGHCAREADRKILTLQNIPQLGFNSWWRPIGAILEYKLTGDTAVPPTLTLLHCPV